MAVCRGWGDVCMYIQLGGRGRGQGRVSEISSETKICVRHRKTLGGLKLGNPTEGGASEISKTIFMWPCVCEWYPRANQMAQYSNLEM